MAYIFDLDQTIVDSSIAEIYRNQRDWRTVFSLIPQFEIYDGIEELFEILHKKNEKICVVTSSPRNYCEAVLQQFGLKTDALVCYHDTKQHKPHPEPILKAVSLLEESPQNIVSIGDAKNDVIASKRAGVTSCLALWGGQGDCFNVEADCVFATVADLIKYII